MKAHEPAEADTICVNPEGARPAKRRKVTHKERTTEYLDLRASYNPSQNDEDLLQHLTSTLRKKQKIVVIAGAGISVSAGSKS
jgi:NAD+-dependent protein deacetylase SIR2